LKPFQIVFKEFLNSDDFKEMIENDETLSKNKDLYSEKAQAFLKIISENSEDN